MKKINILESLKKIDKDTFSEYDLSTLYESHKWSEDQKKQLVRYISSYKDPSFIGQYMADCQGCKNITESDDDDIGDLKFIDMSKEAYLHGGDDYGFDEYDIIDHYDDLEDGYDDEELASGFGGDRNTCPKCGSSNYHDGHCYDCEPDYVPSEIDEAFDKEGGPFWYFTRHGVQPGAVPKGIQILDIIDCADGSGAYFKSDKVLTTKELNDFEIVEKKPEGLKEASTEADDTVTRYKVEYYIDDGEKLETYIYADSTDECEAMVKAEYPDCTITAMIPETVPASYKKNDLKEDKGQSRSNRYRTYFNRIKRAIEKGDEETLQRTKEAIMYAPAKELKNSEASKLMDMIKNRKITESVSGKYGEVKYEPRRDGMSGESAVYANYHLFSNDGKYTPYWAGERPMGRSYNSVEDAVKGIDAFIDRQRKDGKMLYMKPVNEASYGGAYDIADDQYFTKEELVEFGEDVVDNLNSLAYSRAKLESIFIDNNVIEITITWDGNEITVEQPIDMRRIRTPKDLGKYRVPVISKMKPKLEEVGFDFGPHLGDYELSESFDTELRDKLVRMWFEENTADWLVKNDPVTAEWLAYGGATTDDFAEVEEEVLAKLNGEDDPKEAKWERLITKPVNDSDGFTTDYSMWYNDGEKRWVFIFGDSDVYDPTNTDPDWETEDPEEARQWFLDYKGFEDTDENLQEDWRTGTFTRDDLTSYRAEMKKRVEGVVFSIKGMKEKHPEYSEIFDNLTDELVDSMSSLKNESLKEDAEEDELETADQKISSAATSINSNKLPAIFRMVKFQPDTMNLDYGGGKFDNAAEELAKINVTNLVYDPYNRSSEHNQDVLKQVRANGGADTVTISNVLNVIAEPEARQTVLRNAKKLVKPGGKVYITVYEGNKSGSGAETKAGYQLNKDTKDYVDEISQVFDNVTRKGKLIIAE